LAGCQLKEKTIMEFSSKAKELLKKAGWKEGRTISEEDFVLPYNDYPAQVMSFLKEFDNLKIDCEKQDYTPVVNKLLIGPEMEEEDLVGDNDYPYYQSIIGKKLYPLGLYMPDGYYICCDADGRVYMIGEYCYYWGNNLYEGIERILLNSWRSSHPIR
jgi:hypothetical protein